jgi:serine/threonine protein kinase
MTVETGTTLKNRYKILEQLGTGGMGEVYLAEDQTLANKVAVKANHNMNANSAAQFIREARLLASLKHPNLPRVIDYFTENDTQYLVMDYIPGEDLRTLVEKKRKFNTEQILKWAEQLGNAITYLHTQNPPIFHRDIKPTNIKLMPNGEVVLVDFGIAKVGDPSQETLTGAWAFTPGFAPPEQVSGLRTGPQSDQFSLAATLYYVFSGKSPADSARRLMGEEELISLKTLVPDVPQHVSDAIEKALSIKQDARFTTVADFVEAIRSSSPIPDPSSAQKTQMGSRPQPPATPVSIAPPPAIAPPIAPAPALTPKKKKGVGIWIALAGLAVITVVAVVLLSSNTLNFNFNAGSAPMLTPATTVVVVIPPTQEPTQPMPTEQPTSAPATEAAPTATLAPAITAIGHGGRVFFISNRAADGYNQIWSMEVGQDENGNIVTSNLQQVTFTPGDKSKPSFSPDGKYLVYSGLSTGSAANGTPFANDIWTLDISTPNAEPVDISLRAADDLYPAWSPDGRWIAFTSMYREDKIPQLFIMNPQGYEQTRLSPGMAESYAAWTPGANFLVYVLTTGELNILQMRDRYSVYADFQKFDRSSDEGRLGAVMEPNVSLDGQMIAYTRFADANRNVYTAVFADRGRTITKLTDSNTDSAPFWSPDGRWILFTSERDGNKEVYIMDAQGGQVTNLSNLAASDFDPAWQPPAPQ